MNLRSELLQELLSLCVLEALSTKYLSNSTNHVVSTTKSWIVKNA